MQQESKPSLFRPFKLTLSIALAHRVVLAPLTRFRASAAHVPLPHVKEYYAQRASLPGSLLVTEATFVHPRSGGFANSPGIWNQEQVQAWKKIVNAVHDNQSYLFCQLWALGRAAEPKQLAKEGTEATGQPYPFVAPSPIPMPTFVDQSSGTSTAVPVPRALTLAEIKDYIDWFAQAAANAVHGAGFDGVELHAANGYLLDQFLQDGTNQRTDEYGGGIQGRTKFLLDVLEAVIDKVGEERVGVRLSPWNKWQGMGMDDPIPTYTYLITQILERWPRFGYLHVTERRLDPVENQRLFDPTFEDSATIYDENDFIRKLWSAKGKPLITAGGYRRSTALRTAEEKGDLIAFGRFFISNPDLPFRLLHDIPLQKGDRRSFYTKGTTDPHGYTDYPFSIELEEVRGLARL